MKKVQLHIKKSGFSLVEVLLASSLSIVIILGLTSVIISGYESQILSGMRSRAVLIAEEGLEVIRNIKNENFDNLKAGTYGLKISNNEWELTASVPEEIDIFSREIKISDIDAKRKEIAVIVTWQQNLQRKGKISLITRMTNWEDKKN